MNSETDVTVTLQNDVINVTLGGLGMQGPPGPAGVSIIWGEYTANVVMQAGNGYLMNNVSRLTATLPFIANQFDTYSIAGKGVGGWMIAQNAGQTIHVEGISTITGTTGYLMSGTYTDSLDLLCITPNTDFLIRNPTGNIIGN